MKRITLKHIKRSILALGIVLTAQVSKGQGSSPFYNVTPGIGNGVRFWNDDNYKIHMGSTAEYKLSPVITAYSIKCNMSSGAGRGWTWGINGQTPIAALGNTGEMLIKGNFTARKSIISGGNVDVGPAQSDGLRFGNSDSYTITLGGFSNVSEYRYGPISLLSMKMSMPNNAANGWTWGTDGAVPIAGLGTNGDFQIEGDFIGKGNISADADVSAGNNLSAGANLSVVNNVSVGGNISINGTFSAVGNISTNANLFTSGNVGIGTTTPQGKLDVRSGPSYAAAPKFKMSSSSQSLTGLNTSLSLINSDATTNNWARMHFVTPLSNGVETDLVSLAVQYRNRTAGAETADFVIATAGNGVYSEKFRIAGNGNVGIGTTKISDDFKLSVGGNLRAEEIEVSLSGPWADYVFAADYNLKPLDEVESYIKKNKHLPNIPSAKEVEAEGLNLGEMQVKMMEKIEELTLYIIELKHENEKQEKMIEELSKQ